MNIKNIKEYREVYKNEIRKMPDRNENFIGNFYINSENNERIKGWFDLYFGDTDGSSSAQNGVENKLKSFLDMARDGQAIYEFLQNAVDAGGSKFLMFYKEDKVTNEDYLLVINNGEMFTPSSIRSILNIGSSTKSSESDKIGQFGIGFKLAHRLVGKDNATNELINNLNGPILYSWKNNDINNFSDNIEEKDLDCEINNLEEKIIIKDENSWLFKILLTTFPCAYNEKPIIWDGQQANKSPFSEDELNVLVNWLNEDTIKKYIENDFEEGSLFLMKLGEGKLKELKDEPNLKEGVKFSLSVLKETSLNGNGLQTAVINDEEIHHPDLQFHKLMITKNEQDIDDYSFIRFGKKHSELSENEINIVNTESEIQILFGYKDFRKIGNYFKGSPSFYLFFPVSQEVHNFNYILHSNAFYKGSSRVFLQPGTNNVGLNERLFNKIIERIVIALRDLFITDIEKFKNLYLALLTSSKTQNNESFWITKSYTDPLDQSLKTIIPIKDDRNNVQLFNKYKSNNPVYFIDTEIDILLDYNYFILDKNELPIELKNKLNEKLEVKNYNIYSILKEEDSYIKINQWINNNEDRINIFYKELTTNQNYESNNSNNTLTAIQKDNLILTKWIILSDNSMVSIKDIIDKPIILLYKGLFESKDIFQKLNFLTTKNDLADFINKFRNNFDQNELKQFVYNKLTNIFSETVADQDLNRLTNDEKYKLFETFRKLDDSPGERIGLLKLYKNNIGIYQPFANLANENGGLLGLFSVDKQQFIGVDLTNFNRYLKVDATNLYEKIYYPQWKDLLYYLINNPNIINVGTIINDINYAFKNSNWDQKDNNLLGTSNAIIYKNKVINTDKIITYSTIDLDKHLHYQNVLETYYKTYLPDSKYINLFSKIAPFGYKNELNDPELLLENLSIDEINKVLDIAEKFSIPFFESNTIIKLGKKFITNSTYSGKQFYSEHSEVINIFETYFSNQFIILPKELEKYKDLLEYKDYKLSEFLISSDNIESITDIDNLFKVSLNFDLNLRKKIFDNIPLVKLDFNEDFNRINNKLNFINSIKEIDKLIIQEKLIIIKDDKEILLKDVIPTISSININNKTLPFDRIFENKSDENLATDFYSKFIEDSYLDKGFFKNLFNLNATQESSNLLEMFINSLIDKNEIENIFQLYFLVYYEGFQNEDIGEYFVLNQNNEFVSLESNLFFNNSLNDNYFDVSYLLGNNYAEENLELLNDLLNDTEFSFVNHIGLDKNLDYDIFNTEILISEKLDCLFELYNLTAINNRVSDNDKIYEFLKIEDKDKFIDENLNNSNPVSLSILKWHDNNIRKKEFLKFLDFKLNDSLVIKFINALKSNYPDFDDFNLREFKDEDIFLVIDYFVNSEFLFRINNQPLKEKIVDLILVYNQNNSPKTLIYADKFNFRIVECMNLNKIDYRVIDQILNNTEKDRLQKLFTQYHIPIKEIHDEINNEYYNDNETYLFGHKIKKNKIAQLSDYYYNEWKKTVKNINIFRGDELFFDIQDDTNELICEVSYKDDFWDEREGNQLTLFYTSNKSLKSMVEHFSSDDFDEYRNYNLKIRLHQLEEIFNSFNATISDVLMNSDIEEIKDYLNTQIDKEERKVQRETIITEIKESEKYSKIWFIKYLGYLNTVTEKNSSNELQYLRFSKIEKTKNPKFYKLSACSNVIPDNIDESKNVNIKIISGTQRVSFPIINISQKNQTVLIQLNVDLDDNLIDKFFVGEITYLPSIDLLGRLTNAFNKLDEWDDINEIFPAIEYIYGPPGTGKTTTLKERIFSLTKQDDNVKILVLTPTNKACDVLAEKLFNDDYYDFIRLSSQTSINLPEDLYTNDLSNDLLKKKNVVISTIHRHSYYKVSTETSEYFLYNSNNWDYIIIDEASMINLPYITFSALMTKQSNPNCKLIIAGDPKQIPPVPELSDKEVEEIDVRTENIYSMFGLNSFDQDIQKEEVREIDSVVNLDTQYRSLPDIGNLFSNFSYQNKVKTYRDNNSKRVLPLEVQDLLKDTITFLNIPLEKDNPLYSINKLIYSSYHLYSGLLIYEFIKFFDKVNSADEGWTIGIISPYKAQAILINRLLLDLNLTTNIKIFADTVHGFQGDECDIVFYISNPSGYGSSPDPRSLLANDFIYNVAISRAKDYLIIVNPFEKLTENKHINKLKNIHSNYTGNNIKIKSAFEFEKIIFGKKEFINENTFITTHDDVNVYKKGVYRYYIKKNSISIDFQISD